MIDFELLSHLEGFVSEKRKAIFKKVLSERTRHFTVAIEDIYQPHNASAVVRSCDIFGIQDIHVIENKYQFNTSNNVAKGAQKWMDFHYYNEKNSNNTARCMETLRGKGYQIIATTPHNDSCLLNDFDITKKTAFFFGVEKEGLSAQVLDDADGYLKIPMVGFTESLNISVAAAIILNTLTGFLKESELPWGLTQSEKDEKYLEWIEKSIKSIKKIKELFYENNVT